MQYTLPREYQIADALTSSNKPPHLLAPLVIHDSQEHPSNLSTLRMPRKLELIQIEEFMIARAEILKECHKMLALDLFSGTLSATNALARYFRVLTLDNDVACKPHLLTDIKHWDYINDLNEVMKQGLGIPRMVFIASPCNAWSLMRYLPKHPPISQREKRDAQEVVEATVQVILHIQSLLHHTYGKFCSLQVCWENPSSARHLGLMHYLQESGIFQRLRQVGIDMEVLETSQCMFGFPYSKPTHLAVTKQLELAHILPPPCMKHTHFGCCQHGVKGEHLDVRKFDREVLYRLPEPLVNIIACDKRAEQGTGTWSWPC